MKKYINPELNIRKLELETGIMDGSQVDDNTKIVFGQDSWGAETEDEK